MRSVSYSQRKFYSEISIKEKGAGVDADFRFGGAV